MVHVQEVFNFCKRKGFYDAYKTAKAQYTDTIQKSATAMKKLQDAKFDPATPKEMQKALKRSRVLAKIAIVEAKNSGDKKD